MDPAINTSLNENQPGNTTTMVRVPADLLATVLASVEQLKHTVDQVQRDNASMAHELRLLRERERTTYRMDGYCIVNEPWKGPSSPLFYINLDADTIWLRKCTLLPFNVGLYNGTSPERGQVDFLQDFHGDPAELRLNRIAIDFDHWKEPVVNADGIEDMGSIDILRELNNVRELLLVVTQPSMTLSPADVVFVQPTWTPLNPDFDLSSPEIMNAIPQLVSAEAQEALRELNLRMHPASINLLDPDLTKPRGVPKRRMTNVTSTMITRHEDLKLEKRAEWDLLNTYCEWDVPKVRYVEAVEKDPHRIQVPDDN
ncbi:uncharacterized protein PAC_01606 [Phialocephala subalpina]|uniref:Uncharacterized protein n=1 Tax=Phialocephala subalpina TaxID=576137 RepID=A0A1L7WG57_9HELO|nr:uncharacterized protein PAC_01606 [Phialocephala subalpina]